MSNPRGYRWVRRDGADYVRFALSEPGKFGWEGPFDGMREAIAWIDEVERREETAGEQAPLAERLAQLNDSDTIIRKASL